MIDVHIHSTNSDGTYTPEEIVKQAKEKKLDLIALTDHNTLDGANTFAEAAKKYNQPAIVGTEISSVYKNEEIHLLAYFPLNANFYYPQYDNLRKINDNYKYGKRSQLEEIIENIGKDYEDVSVEEFYSFIKKVKSDENYNRVHVANYLMYKGIISSTTEGFEKFLNEDSKYYVYKERTQLLDAIKVVHEAGGFPVIAHIGQYNLNDNQLVGLFCNIGTITKDFGVELYHYNHTREDIIRLKNLVKGITSVTKLNITFTAGSDCHGENKPNEIGIPYNFELSKNDKKELDKLSDNFVKFIEERFKIKEKQKER